ncbi:hypothetical protein AGMMS50284_6980 [Clostridia bacterium]|nr:hypothetical protein AGMMS50284_6980 [Clostridia bacterium]
MEKENKKIKLPKELQIEMLKFFLQTSIPRIKKEHEKDKSELSKENR